MKIKSGLTCISFVLAVMATCNAKAQIDTIGKRNSKLLTEGLKPGLNQYIIYMMDPKNPKVVTFWFWSREIKFQERGGKKLITNTQTWLGGDTVAYRTIYSENNASDFSPVYHKETARGKTKAYAWSPTNIKGADNVLGNAAKDFSLDFKSPNYNWNLDIETYEQLPLAAGKTFAINFYDAGLDPPQYVIYKVSGSETLKSYDNQNLECWILSTEGEMPKGGKYSERYWISKRTHEFIKEEDTYPGGYRYKIRMGDVMPDLMKTFQSKNTKS